MFTNMQYTVQEGESMFFGQEQQYCMTSDFGQQFFAPQVQYTFVPVSAYLPLPEPSTSCSTNSSSEDSDSGEDAPQVRIFGFKTRLCRHFSRSGRCPMGDSCGFAHGAHELHDTRKTLEKRALNPKHKTKLCANYARGGSGRCPYGEKCEYVHPTDKEYHLEWYAETAEFHHAQQEFKDRVQLEHKRKFAATNIAEEYAIDVGILRMVQEWNKGHPRGPHYYDFHGLTVYMAERYIEEIIDSMVASGERMARIETGRGNHSTNGFAAIRATILAGWQGYKGAQFVPEVGNDGILVLSFP